MIRKANPTKLENILAGSVTLKAAIASQFS